MNIQEYKEFTQGLRDLLRKHGHQLNSDAFCNALLGWELAHEHLEERLKTARNAALEEAALKCCELERKWWNTPGPASSHYVDMAVAAWACADSIRNLKEGDA